MSKKRTSPKPLCIKEGCGGEMYAKGLCRKHYAHYIRQSKRVIQVCLDCGRPMPLRMGKGKFFLRCEECLPKHLRRRDSARYYNRRRKFVEFAICIVCETIFPRTGRGGPIPRWCEPCKKYRKRELDRANGASRRARKLQLPNETILPDDVYLRDGWLCQICHTKIDPELAWPDPQSKSIDHIKPLSRGGNHVMSNVQAAHLSCNLKKSTKILTEHFDGETNA